MRTLKIFMPTGGHGGHEMCKHFVTEVLSDEWPIMKLALEVDDIWITTAHPVTDDDMHSGHQVEEHREEFAVWGQDALPMGDERHVLEGSSRLPYDHRLRRLFRRRSKPQPGRRWGVSWGNKMIYARARKNRGDWIKTLDDLCELLKVSGRVYPITLRRADIIGQPVDTIHAVPEHMRKGLVSPEKTKSLGPIFITREGHFNIRSIDAPPVQGISLSILVQVVAQVRRAIEEADVIIIGPGSFWSSIMVLLGVMGVAKAIRFARRRGAKIIYVANLVAKRNETEFDTTDIFVDHICEILRVDKIDAMFYHDFETYPMPEDVKQQYWKDDRSSPVHYAFSKKIEKAYGGNYMHIAGKAGKYQLRHNLQVVRSILKYLVDEKKGHP